MALIELKDIHKSYPLDGFDLEILKGITLQIEQGEFVAIMGPSGSGKSTLMNILGCLDTPTSGSYYLDGNPVENLTPDELAEIRNQKIGFVFQGFNLLSRTTALENVELPMVYSNTPAYERLERAKKALKDVGLEERMNHMPNQLSGGQKQRVAIARAMVTKPKILLADEPTGALDSVTGKQVMELFRKINHEEGTTIIIVTHDPGIGASTERCIRILDGKIVEEKAD